MTDKLQQTIKEEVEKLPQEAREAIDSLDWAKIAEEIGVKYLFNEEEITNLQTETLLVLVGLVDPEFYAINIENHVETTKDTANKIAGEVLEKIFTPLNDILIENIKKGLQNKNPNTEQTLNFILSGGNYSAFMVPTNSTPLLDEEGVGGGKTTTSPRPESERSSFNKEERTTPTPVPKKIPDLRDKFTI